MTWEVKWNKLQTKAILIGELFQIEEKVSGKRNQSAPSMKEADGTALIDKDDVKERWTGHFQELLNRPQPIM